MCTDSTVNYGKEPFDLRLTVLRMLRNLHIVLGVTLLGSLLVGACHYIHKTVFDGKTMYTVTSTYKLSYVDNPTKSGDYSIHSTTWETYVDSAEFLNAVLKHLEEDAVGYDSLYVSSAEELSKLLSVRLTTDIYLPATTVTTDSEEWTLLIAQAVEKTMVGEFVEGNEQLASMRVIDPALTTEVVLPDIRTSRAFALGAVLSFLFVTVILLLKEIGSGAVWLPVTLQRRYGLIPVGTLNSSELQTNLEYVLKESKVAVCAADKDINPIEVIGALGKEEWIPVPAPMLCPEACQVMRQSDKVLLVVKAGRSAGKPLEYVLEFLATQEISVSAVLLWDADEWLIKTYYMFGKV